MRKMMCVMMVFALLVCSSVSSAAVDNNELKQTKYIVSKFTRSEYDMLMSIHTKSEKELLLEGYTVEDIEVLQAVSIEEAICERAKMSEEELSKMGYTDEQISLLRTYDGSPLSENPQMRGIFADVDGWLYAGDCNENCLRVTIVWEWTNAPLFSGTSITDSIACAFQGINNNSHPVTVKLNPSNTSCKLYYYSSLGALIDVVEDVDVDHTAVNTCISAEIPMGKWFDDEVGWAKHGELSFEIEEQVEVNALNNALFAFGYGHTTLGNAPDVSASLDGLHFSFDFGVGFTEMFYKEYRVFSTGNYHEED